MNNGLTWVGPGAGFPPPGQPTPGTVTIPAVFHHPPPQMPAPPNVLHSRKGPTPILKADLEALWKRKLEALGVVPMNEGDRPIPLLPTATAQISALMNAAKVQGEMSTAAASGGAPEEKRKLVLQDLPVEIQKKIWEESTPADLIALSLVSKHFRDIAAHRLYRSFHIVFPDDDEPLNGSLIDSLAGGLDTFATSEYDYAQYLREIVLDTSSSGNKGEQCYRHYLYDASCGKFMNTLLLLTLRKARALETFRWDIRVELSRQVFKALHRIRALQHLRLRMQAGPSLYEEPPALPTSSTETPLPSDPPPPPGPSLYNAAAALFPLPPLPPTSSVNSGPSPNFFSMGGKLPHKSQHKASKSTHPGTSKPPPSISGFTGLKSLSILDMDTYEYVDEIKSCLHNCSSTLTTLQLSFSESLANKSRRPPQENQSDDESEEEDDFGQPIPLGPPQPIMGASDPNGPSKVLKAQEEKKTQDAILGKIFGLEPSNTKPKSPTPPPSIPLTAPKPQGDPKKYLIRNLDAIAAKLMAHLRPGSDISKEGKETLAMIEKAVELYLGSKDKKDDKVLTTSGGEISKATPASLDGSVDDETVVSGAASIIETPGLFDEPKKKKERSVDSGISNPDDIDIDLPEGEDLTLEIDAALGVSSESSEPTDASISSSIVANGSEIAPSAILENISSANEVQPLNKTDEIFADYVQLAKRSEEIVEILEKSTAEVQYFMDKVSSGTYNAEDISAMFKIHQDQISLTQKISRMSDDVSQQTEGLYKHIEDLNSGEKDSEYIELGSVESSNMSEYVRNTRGLTLKTLAVYLIPIKSSILSRVIDLSVLQNITLLNVGPQIPFWNLLTRQNKRSDLTIRKIHTDNVTVPFLAFVSGLGTTLEELYMLERSAKAKVESTAAKTTVTIEQIRQAILRKHAGTLKVLMIRNDNGMEWDVDVKTAMLLCRRAAQLQELAVSFGTRTMHTILQCFYGLKSLRALHTIQFRTNDPWVMRELRKFFTDNISLHPETKLEYLALDLSVERLVRRKPSQAIPAKDKKGKGKVSPDSTNSKTLVDLIMDSEGPWSDGSVFGTSHAVNSYGTPSPWGASAPYDLEESSDDEGALGLVNGLNLDTVVGARFCDIPGIKIFTKEIMSGQL